MKPHSLHTQITRLTPDFKRIKTLGTTRLGIHLKQKQKVQLAQIVHQAIHPRPIHNDMQRLPCNRSIGSSAKVVAALLAFLSYTA